MKGPTAYQKRLQGTFTVRQKAKAKPRRIALKYSSFQHRRRGKITSKRGKVFGSIGANALRIKAHKSKQLGGDCLCLAGCYPHTKSCPQKPIKGQRRREKTRLEKNRPNDGQK
jgi:hypothetical protein